MFNLSLTKLDLSLIESFNVFYLTTNSCHQTRLYYFNDKYLNMFLKGTISKNVFRFSVAFIFKKLIILYFNPIFYLCDNWTMYTQVI